MINGNAAAWISGSRSVEQRRGNGVKAGLEGREALCGVERK